MYLINRAPSSQLDFDISEERWLGKRISYNHLRVLGCEAFAHVPKDQRMKLDPKSKRCIFTSYGEEQFGFCLWDPIAKKITRSGDVVFNENVFPALQKQRTSSNEHIQVDIFDNGKSHGYT